MSDKRLNTQLTLAFPTEERGEALRAVAGSVESFAANRPVESPGMGEPLMEAVCEWSSIQQAVRRVKRNHGSAGVDGMTVHHVPAYLRQHWSALRAHLLAWMYVPSPVKRVEIPQLDSEKCRLGIPTIVDRCLQQAVLQVLQGAIVRKQLGYVHIPQQWAPQLNAFHRDHLNPYINFHRPCFFPVVIIDAKGKSRKRYPYETRMTPYEKFTSRPKPAQYLKSGRTLQQLDDIATAISDNEAAKHWNAAKHKLYQTIFEQKHRIA